MHKGVHVAEIIRRDSRPFVCIVDWYRYSWYKIIVYKPPNTYYRNGILLAIIQTYPHGSVYRVLKWCRKIISDVDGVLKLYIKSAGNSFQIQLSHNLLKKVIIIITFFPVDFPNKGPVMQKASLYDDQNQSLFVKEVFGDHLTNETFAASYIPDKTIYVYIW